MAEKPSKKKHENLGASRQGMPYSDLTSTHGGRASPDANGDQLKAAQENGRAEGHNEQPTTGNSQDEATDE